MAQIPIRIRVDAETKKKFDNICKQAGVTSSAAIKVFIYKVINECRIPFEDNDWEIPNAVTRAAIRETEEMAKHPEKYKSYMNVSEMMRDILGEI